MVSLQPQIVSLGGVTGSRLVMDFLQSRRRGRGVTQPRAFVYSPAFDPALNKYRNNPLGYGPGDLGFPWPFDNVDIEPREPTRGPDSLGVH